MHEPLSLPATPRPFSALIDDRLIGTGECDTIGRSDPAHERPVSLYPKATLADATEAVRAARRAADAGVWRSLSTRPCTPRDPAACAGTLAEKRGAGRAPARRCGGWRTAGSGSD